MFDRRPIAQQLIFACFGALLLIFVLMILLVQRKADQVALSVAEQNLTQEARLMAGMLDSVFEAARARAESNSQFFVRHAGGAPVIGTTLVQTGELALPEVRMAGELLNGNTRILDAFRELTGADAALLVVKEGKLYRASTLLKDKDGKSMFGSLIKDSDPVAKAVLAGQDYQGLTIRGGKYNFSTVKVLKGGDGQVAGAYSIRISLDGELQRIRERFGKVVAGKTGYVFILRPTDEQSIAEFVLHPRLQESSLSNSDLPGSVKEALASLLAQKTGVARYFLPDESGTSREKIAVAATSDAWGWTVFTGSWLDEYLEENRALRNLMALIGFGAALALALAIYLLVNARLAGLRGLAQVAARLSQGDLRATLSDVDPDSRNEVHRIGYAFNQMVDSIRDLVSGVTSSSRQVDGAASELHEAAKQARDSSEQASQSVSGIAASVEELSVSITHVADNANQATQISEQAKSVTDTGNAALARAIGELEQVAREISESAAIILCLGERSQQISSVVGVIREIADQTNLLALNAAIEAARAGEQGRGFAVVADEVRKLAERTALSTQEIASTIRAIQEETAQAVERMQGVSTSMGESVGLAREAGESLQRVDQHATETVTVVQGIADSTREQSAGSQEIARLVERIAQMAAGNSGRASINIERAQNLHRLSAELQAQLSRFTT